MKGTPTLRWGRLKQAAVLTGVTALVAAGAVLGGGQAHAAGSLPTQILGNGKGLVTASPATGPTNGNVTWNSPACPTGSASAELLLVDQLQPTTSEQLVAPIANSVAAPFTFTSSTASGNAINTAILALADDPAGGTAEVVVECFTQASGGGTGTYTDDDFLQFTSDDSTYTQVPNPGVSSGPPVSVNLTLTANPSTATSGQTVTLTATASAANATGTVQFENNGTNIGAAAPLSGGTVSTATTPFTAPTVTAATTATLTAVYSPTGNFTAGTAGSLSLPVNPAPANSGTIPLAVSVPQSGSFTLTVDTTDVVTLTATGLTASGTTTPITVADTRNSYPGWSVSGQDSAWTGTGTAAGGTFSGNQLGWQPTDTALAPAVTLGSTVAPVSPGLGTNAATLASVHAGLGNGYGTSTLGATLALDIPPTAPAGPYTSGLTISAVTSNP
jgi:hypothetical protein